MHANQSLYQWATSPAKDSFVWFFDTVSHYIALAGLEIAI